MLIWIPSLISVPPTAPSVVCQPRFKMQSRANFPSSQLQIISNFEFPPQFPWFSPASVFPRFEFRCFSSESVCDFPDFPCCPVSFSFPWFNSVSGAFGRLSRLKRGLRRSRELVELITDWYAYLLQPPLPLTSSSSFIIHHLPYAYLYLVMPTYYICLHISTTTNIIIFAINFVKE